MPLLTELLVGTYFLCVVEGGSSAVQPLPSKGIAVWQPLWFCTASYSAVPVQDQGRPVAATTASAA